MRETLNNLFKRFKKTAWNLIVWIDQGFNVVLGLFADGFGDPDETISSVLGKKMHAGKCPICKFICRNILHPLDKDHCNKSVEGDEGENSIK